MPMLRHRSALVVLMMLVAVPLQAAEWTIVHAGTLLEVPGRAPSSERSVVVRDGRIESVRDGFVTASELGASADEVKILDLSDAFVLPGLMDMHTHLTGELGPSSKLAAVTMSDAQQTVRALPFLERTLMAGFTTVRNTGGSPDIVFALREATAAGTVTGPRIFAAGAGISATGGHGDAHGYRQEILDLYADSSICDGAADCRRAVRNQVKRGSDLIKITATGGVLSETAAGTGQQLFDDELVAIVETASSLGRKVAAHAHGADGINAALRAGVSSIEHGTFADDESFRLFRETGAYLVPTLLAGKTVVDMATHSEFMAEPVRQKALAVGPQMMETVARAHEAGVKIAFGTDSGVSRHGDNAQELLLMAEAGIPPADCLMMATVATAELLGQTDRLGTLEVGKIADLIAVDGDPIANLEELLDVDFVMKGGVVYKQP